VLMSLLLGGDGWEAFVRRQHEARLQLAAAAPGQREGGAAAAAVEAGGARGEAPVKMVQLQHGDGARSGAWRGEARDPEGWLVCQMLQPQPEELAWAAHVVNPAGERPDPGVARRARVG
jgi:hypothetical protein